MFAAFSVWRALDDGAPAAPSGFSTGLNDQQSGTFSPAARSPFERGAESFLHDSLRLTQVCEADCGSVASEIAEAQLSGRFGSAGIATSPGNAPLRTSLPFQERFGPRVAAPAPALPQPVNAGTTTFAKTIPAPPPAPVHIEPSVVVPLPPVFFAPAPVAAPVPAARLDRPSSEAIAQPSEPTIAELPPPVRRAVSPLASLGFGRNDGVAVYDISAATVYMPDGSRLEAHSGMGPMVDNPRFVDRIDTGPTPPNVYNLIMRKGRFHGVEALRLIPANGNNRFGRVGLLAHTYLLRGRPAESNGCVAFKDYERFLDAFKRGYVTRLVVVPSLSGTSLRIAMASGGA